MNWVYAVLASAGWLFVSGLVIYGWLLSEWNERHFGHISRDSKSFPLWAAVGEKLLQASALTILVSWTSLPLALLFLAPLLFAAASSMSIYSDYRVLGRPVFTLFLIDSVRLLGALYIVGFILGRTLW